MLSQEEMNVLVPEKLREIEKEYGIEILWAIESGSRAWGFASTDSDFDVRFIYKRTPENYLKLNTDRDVIEIPIDETWDVSGWDLDKTLKLLYKSNPTLFEWINSPIIYKETDFINRFRNLSNNYFSEKKMVYHYLNTAKKHVKQYLSGEEVKPKKYFYALRPLLACLWIKEYHTVPPILFNELVETVLPKEMKVYVDELLNIKLNSPEDELIAPIKEINEYLEKTIAGIEVYASLIKEETKDWDSLNNFFIEEIGE